MDASAPSPSNANLYQDRPDLRVGAMLCGKWRIESLLGIGAMGAVYAARHNNGNRVAIKILHASLAEYQQIKDRFLNEGRAANRVRHRAVTTVHDEGVAEDGSIFLVMELLKGQTLEAYQDTRGNLTPLQVLQVAHEILDALKVAHAEHVLHRDIKPANLFLTFEGRIVLLDFGVAQLNESRSATQLGIPIGTPSYMPPEQASGRWLEVDARSDLWALGATMFKLLSGRTVRQTATADEELRAAIGGIAPSLAEVCSAPAAVVALVDKALAFDSDDRFPDAMAMQNAVREAMVALQYALPRESSPPLFGMDGPWIDPDDESTTFSMLQDEHRASSVRLKSPTLDEALGLRARLPERTLFVGAGAVVVLAGLLVALASGDEVTRAKSSLTSVRSLSGPTPREAMSALNRLDFGIDLTDVLRQTGDDDPPRVRRARAPVKAPSEPFDPLRQRE